MISEKIGLSDVKDSDNFEKNQELILQNINNLIKSMFVNEVQVTNNFPTCVRGELTSYVCKQDIEIRGHSPDRSLEVSLIIKEVKFESKL